MGPKIDRSKKPKELFASMVPSKSSLSDYPSKVVLSAMKEFGLETSEVITKSKQEDAIKAVVDTVIKSRKGVGTIPENSAVGESAAMYAPRAASSSSSDWNGGSDDDDGRAASSGRAAGSDRDASCESTSSRVTLGGAGLAAQRVDAE